MRKPCPNKEENEKECSCVEGCERHGICCLCIKYHNARGSKPHCII